MGPFWELSNLYVGPSSGTFEHYVKHFSGAFMWTFTSNLPKPRAAPNHPKPLWAETPSLLQQLGNKIWKAGRMLELPDWPPASKVCLGVGTNLVLKAHWPLEIVPALCFICSTAVPWLCYIALVHFIGGVVARIFGFGQSVVCKRVIVCYCCRLHSKHLPWYLH